jgi:predicted nucleic acid-binding Zn ribbon protein
LSPAEPEGSGPSRPRKGRRAARSGEVQAIGSVLDSLAGDRPLASGLALGQLGRRWEAVVGERLAGECSPAALEGGFLLVRASSGAWAAQVRFLAAEVRERANEVLGFTAVREVKVAVKEGSGHQ